MIKFQIPALAATFLLTEKMQAEFDCRKSHGIYGDELELHDLNFKELLEITELAAFDLIVTLPAIIYSEKNNLPYVIHKTISGLWKTFGYEEFKEYELERAEFLVNRISDIIKQTEKDKTYLIN